MRHPSAAYRLPIATGATTCPAIIAAIINVAGREGALTTDTRRKSHMPANTAGFLGAWVSIMGLVSLMTRRGRQQEYKSRRRFNLQSSLLQLLTFCCTLLMMCLRSLNHPCERGSHGHFSIPGVSTSSTEQVGPFPKAHQPHGDMLSETLHFDSNVHPNADSFSRYM